MANKDVKCNVCGGKNKTCYQPAYHGDPSEFTCSLCAKEWHICNYCHHYDRVQSDNGGWVDLCNSEHEVDNKDAGAPNEVDPATLLPPVPIDEEINQAADANDLEVLVLMDFVRTSRVRAAIMNPKQYKKWMISSIDAIGEYMNVNFNIGGIHAGEAKGDSSKT